LRDALTKTPELEADVFEALQCITPEQIITKGRVYGGGLYKVEPKELAQIPARPVLDAIKTYVHIDCQSELFA
jgi:hypothetical protein